MQTDEEIAREFGLEPTEALSAALRRVREETLEEAARIECGWCERGLPCTRAELLDGGLGNAMHAIFTDAEPEGVATLCRAWLIRNRMARASNAPKEGK